MCMKNLSKVIIIIIMPLLILTIAFPASSIIDNPIDNQSENAILNWDFKEASRSVRIDTENKLLWNLTGHTSEIWETSFDPNGNLLASASGDGTVRIWNVTTGEEIKNITDHGSPVFCVAFNPTGEILASGSFDNSTLLWNVTNWQLIGNLTGHSSLIWSLEFSHDGKYLASGSADNTIKIWDVKTQVNIENITGHTENVKTLSFSSDDRLLASGSDDNTIKVWNFSNSILIHDFTNHTDYIESIDFSPDDQLLASASRDLSIKLWDVEAGNQVQELLGHEGEVRSISFSPDGNSLASSSNDYSVKFWDVRTGNLLGNLTDHTNFVVDISFNPSSQILASCSVDQNIKLWNITDIDSDNLPDSWEYLYQLNPGNYDDRNEDPDNDDLINLFELYFGTNPKDSDSDNDLIPDGYEYNNQLNGTFNDANEDLDGDEIPNLYEYQHNLSINLNDSVLDYDEDGMPNLYEFQNGLLAGYDDSHDDLDGDGIPNLYEFQHNLLVGVDDAATDLDNDSLTNFDEYRFQTDPHDADSDNDGWMDGIEKTWGTDPNLSISNPITLIFVLISGVILIIGVSFFIKRNSQAIKSSISSLYVTMVGSSWFNDLMTGKAIPIDLLAKNLNQKALAIPEIIKQELIQHNESNKLVTMQSRILLLESIPLHDLNCQICMSDIQDDHYYQCKQCKRFVCIHDYVDLKNVGRSDCPNCSGELVILPFTCVACKLDFASVKELSSQTRCTLCGYELPNQTELSKGIIGTLKPSALSQKIKNEKETEVIESNEKKKNLS